MAEVTADLLIANGVVVTIDDTRRILENASLAVTDGVITAVGPALQVRAKRTIDARGNIVMPGLVDAHMHECLLRGCAEDLPLMRWLEEICFPRDRAFEPHHMRAAALLGQLEMIQSGITTFIDIYRFPAEAAKVAERSGLRAIFSPQIIESPKGAGESIADSEEFVREWRVSRPCPSSVSAHSR